MHKERRTSSLTPGPSLFVCCLFYFPFPKCARLYDRPLLSVPCLISFIEMRGFTCCSRFKLSVHHAPLCLSGLVTCSFVKLLSSSILLVYPIPLHCQYNGFRLCFRQQNCVQCISSNFSSLSKAKSSFFECTAHFSLFRLSLGPRFPDTKFVNR